MPQAVRYLRSLIAFFFLGCTILLPATRAGAATEARADDARRGNLRNLQRVPEAELFTVAQRLLENRVHGERRQIGT